MTGPNGTAFQHCDWASIPVEQIADGIERQMIWGEQLMVCRLRFAPRVVTAIHSHPHEQITLVERGRVRFTIAGQERVSSAGDVLHFPSQLRARRDDARGGGGPDRHLFTGPRGVPSIQISIRGSRPMNASLPIRDADKRAALEQVLTSATFVRATQVRNFLALHLRDGAARPGHTLHEYLIGVEALGRPNAYSTDEDSSVRRRAFALRRKLDEVYAHELAHAPSGSSCPRAATCRSSSATLHQRGSP